MIVVTNLNSTASEILPQDLCNHFEFSTGATDTSVPMEKSLRIHTVVQTVSLHHDHHPQIKPPAIPQQVQCNSRNSFALKLVTVSFGSCVIESTGSQVLRNGQRRDLDHYIGQQDHEEIP